MRWFVEVSRIGENGVAEEYCVEAKQWQAALQEARKLRGDSGALSQFSIELLDHGYRAVDPTLKLRYLVTQAPDTARLTGSSTNGATPLVPSVAPPMSLAATSGSLVPRPSTYTPPRPASLVPRASAAPRAQQLVVPDDPVPPPPAALGLASPPDSAEASLPELPPHADSASAGLPAFELVRERSEEPRADSPITYRELAFAVAPGATRSQVEALLNDRYQVTLATIADHPAGKFVQLAVFDHVFQRGPERPPLATFAWKDWRGAPVLAFPGFGEAPMGPLSQVPPAQASVMPPSNDVHARVPAPSSTGAASPASGSLAPSPMLTLEQPRSESVPVSAAPPGVVEPPPVVSQPMPAVAIAAPAPARDEVATAAAEALPQIAEPAISSAAASAAELEAEDVPVFPEPAAVAAPTEPAAPAIAPQAPAEVAVAAQAPSASAAVPPVSSPGFELRFESAPFAAAPGPELKSSAKRERVSRPRLPGRRRADEDLISELFEYMHELHFQRDVAAGAEFVLSVLDEVLPCEGVLIHVFDINTGHFVVVRAKGPNATAVLLQRMPDQDPFALSVMRSPRSISVPNAANDPRFNGARWQAVGVVPKYALAGAVHLGGRYLGLIELLNPQGDTPFHSSELNALDYICQQFAEFLSNKPLVLAADVVLARV